MPRRKLLVPGVESMLDQYREEIGEEFGIYRPVSERDAMVKESEKKSKTDDKDKKEKSRRK
ncbi:hypothetical protein QUF79_12550 [Fictibacillus enclensis]|uniref:hypothetical protein n=1 Tax=Fictibacillus enclensis TaxID=1017270 RepID=UPI0025A2CEF9|nr:hypothetical protein [Fictibacillus enclensis]MDM5198853.1 hypothetical protein [Fictibacillus enclensis]